METKLEDKEEIYVDASVLYDSQIIHCKIEIPFHEIVNGSSNITHEKMLENHFFRARMGSGRLPMGSRRLW